VWVVDHDDDTKEEIFDDDFSVLSKGTAFISIVVTLMRIIVFIAALFAIALYFLNAYSITLRKNLGVEAVTLMYNFDSLEEVKENQKRLAQIMDNDTYKGLTIDNENRQLYTYVRYYGDRSIINIVEATDRYVLYRIESEQVEADRLFIMLFEVEGGRISKIKECECFGFIEDTDYLY